MQVVDRPESIVNSGGFVAAVWPHDRQLRALAYRMLGSETEMDDALQDAYLRAFRNRRKYRGDSAFSTWLYRIVYTTCIDHLRKRREFPVAEEVLDSRVPNPSNPAREVSRRVDLEAALRSLSAEDRALALLVDGAGFRYVDAARVLSIPEGTVASRLHRIRSRLRATLSDPDEDR